MLDLLDTTRTIKTLSLWQPFASLMAAHVRLHETRDWSTDYRGPIAIHAAKTLDAAGAPDDLCVAALGRAWRRTVPRGAIVAIGELTHCREAIRARHGLTSADLTSGHYGRGWYAWRISNLRALPEPIEALGRQGLFNWTPPADLEDRLGPTVDHEGTCRRLGWA